jgi:predicted RNase H-like HicB family nuclease
MKQIRQLTVIIEREDGGYVALCPELDIASQGDSAHEAKSNLTEAVELFFETADSSEVKARLHGTRLEDALLSEVSLSKDWLTPEEDEAWQDL